METYKYLLDLAIILLCTKAVSYTHLPDAYDAGSECGKCYGGQASGICGDCQSEQTDQPCKRCV